MSHLDETKLEKVSKHPDKITAQCPACFEEGSDKTGDHLSVWPSGKFACVQFPGPEGKEHRKRIFELVGIPDQKRTRRTFETLERAIAHQQVKLGKATRRDRYNDRFVIVRFDDPQKGEKEFRPVHQTKDGWVIGDPPGKLPLLNLPELSRPDLNRESSSEPVFVVEGEKCTCELRDKLGLLATTSAHGSNSAHKTDWEPLAGRVAVILPDNDPPGRGYAQKAAALLLQLSPQAKVKIVELPGLPPEGDCVDWIAARNGKPPAEIKAELLELVKNAEVIRQAAVEPVVLALPPPPYVAPPLDLFPDEVQRFIRAGAATFDVDPAFFLLPIMSGAASMIGNARSIRLKEDHIEPPIIWAGIIAPTGDSKSPTLKAATAPVEEREKYFAWINRKNAKKFAGELAQWEATPKKERGKKPEQPVLLTCLMDDATIEAVARRLNDNPHGIVLIKDELSHWFESMDQYHDRAGSDVSRWLSLWLGGLFALDRSSGERSKSGGRSYRIPNPRLSIYGGIVPEVFKRCLTDDYFERGLPARFLFAMPTRNKPNKWIDESIPARLKQKLHELFKTLAALQPHYAMRDDGEQDEGTPLLLGLSAEAKKIFVDFFDECSRRKFEANPREAAQWSKLRNYSARLALVGQLMRDPDADEISGDVMRAAHDLARWFGIEAARIYALIGETAEQRERRKLIEFIENRGGAVTERDVYNNFWRLKNKPKETTSALEALVRNRLGEWQPIPPTAKGGQPTRKFCLFRPPPSAQPHDLRGNADSSAGADARDVPENNPEFSVL